MQDILYNPLISFYKNPIGAVLANELVNINIGINKNFQIYNLKIIINKDYSNSEISYDLQWLKNDELYNYYNVSFQINDIGIYWYCFCFDDCYGHHFIFYQENCEVLLSDEKRCWQLSVHQKFLGKLDWFQGKVMYQIMVDRFYSGGVTYQKKNIIMHQNWDEIPNYMPINGEILNNDFFGGDLLGIIQKLDYLKELNVSIILLNPIFLADSNHKYDTADYMKIDPMFGNDKIFKELCSEAKKRNISIVLDGVFNHSGSNSIYFNKNGTYDNLGAYQSIDSPYYNWYLFNNFPNNYQSWWGFNHLPQFNQKNDDYINFITGKKGVINKWIKNGARGFRLDVVDEYQDDFIKKISKSLKELDNENLLIGEVWEDASNKIAYSQRKSYFSGEQLDSVMNYPFRKAIIDFINNNNIYGFRNCIRNIINNYPKHVLDSLMNILSTHDTIRILNAFIKVDYHYLSKKEQAEYEIPYDEYYLSRQMLKIASTMQFTLPGVPCIFYGDEVGIQGFNDPFCRKTMPWGHFDEEILSWYKKLGHIREDEIFIDGIYEEEFVSDNIFAYSRHKNSSKIIIIINNGNTDFQYSLDKGYDMINDIEVNNSLNVLKKNVAIIKVSN